MAAIWTGKRCTISSPEVAGGSFVITPILSVVEELHREIEIDLMPRPETGGGTG